MATIPPPPPQDPRAAWRAQRDAWKAQMRAQRDQMRAQRYYWRSMRRPSFAGPIVLLSVGIIALLVQTGKLNGHQFWTWYTHWWPLLLIGVGLISLVEWYFDRDKPYGARRSYGGIVVLIIVLSIVGYIVGAAHNMNWGPIGEQFGHNGDDFWALQGPEHVNDDQVAAEVPASSAVQIQNPRGDVIITAATDGRLHFRAHEVVHTTSDDEAKKAFTSLMPKLTISGNSVLLHVEGTTNGKTDLTVELPAGASSDINAGRGDVTVTGLKGAANVTSGHGDVKFETMGSSAHARMSKGDFSAHGVQGELTVDGHGNDVTLSEIRGKVLLEGDFFGDIHLEQIAAPVHFHSMRTDIELTRVDGDMTMDSSDLHIQQANGPTRITTNNKQIECAQMYGDVRIENKNGDVTVSSASPMGTIFIQNQKGAINFSAPPNAGFNVDAHTNDGEIETDFPLSVNGGENDKSLNGQVGKGGPKVTLTVTHGDIHLSKGGNFPTMAPPSAPPAPPAPPEPGAKHLKAPKGVSEQPTVQ